MPEVRLEKRARVGWITLDNVAKHNSVNSEMSAQLREAFLEVERDREVRCVVIAGAGEKAFSTGGQMDSYVAGGVLGNEGSGEPSGIQKADKITKPVIAAIRGYCLAGGFGLALSCDLRIVATDALMGPSGLKRGVVPAAQQTERLVKLVPFGKALEILLLAKYIGAEEALAIGLAQAMVEPGDLLGKAEEWSSTIASFSPVAVRDTKKLAYAAHSMDWESSFKLGAEVMAASFKTEDATEGFKAFLEKRPAEFTGN